MEPTSPFIFDKIIKYRGKVGLPQTYAGTRSVDKVAASFRIGGELLRGRSGWWGCIQDLFGSLRTKNWNFAKHTRNMDTLYDLNIMSKPWYRRFTFSHAEGNVMLSALNRGLRGRIAGLYVDAKLCKSCGLRGNNVLEFARVLGIEELQVVVRLPNGRYAIMYLFP